MIECVVNVSEGRSGPLLERLAAAAGDSLLDVHTDPHHHRAVFTLVGEEAVRYVTAEAVASIDLEHHDGVHPRLGAVDVVPFVALGDHRPVDAVAARDRFAAWAADELGLPCFVYGRERTLPEVRHGAFTTFGPDTGPDRPHPTAGAVAVGSRPVLVAYNLWLAVADLDRAHALARELRGPSVRALGLAVGDRVQVSMNLIAPDRVGPSAVYDQVAASVDIARAELVGLAPASVLDAVDPDRWPQLDLAPDRTIEARVAARGHEN
jgi:glutamate formiminotransferase